MERKSHARCGSWSGSGWCTGRGLNAFVACADDHGDAHRPAFVICRDCGEVQELEDGRVVSVARKAAGEGFAIDTVSLEIYGRCAPCDGAA